SARVVEQEGGNNQVKLLPQVERANILDVVADAERLGCLLAASQFDHVGRQIHPDNRAGPPGPEQARIEALATSEIESRLPLERAGQFPQGVLFNVLAKGRVLGAAVLFRE